MVRKIILPLPNLLHYYPDVLKNTIKKVVILIDEYDVPLENAYLNGFYDQMVSFIRSLFESALKTNESLKLAVVTGCLRISRESNVSAKAETSENAVSVF